MKRQQSLSLIIDDLIAEKIRQVIEGDSVVTLLRRGLLGGFVGMSSLFMVDSSFMSSAFGADLPQKGRVEAGRAVFKLGADRLDIHQSSDRVTLSFDSYRIGRGHTVEYHQPSSSSLAVNKLGVGSSPMEVLGNLRANGQVVFVSPSGVMISPDARIDVGSIVATSASQVSVLSDGRMSFSDAAAGNSVVNEGRITVREGGYAALVGPMVRNDGVIVAKLGQVVLGSATSFTVDPRGGNGLVSFEIGRVPTGGRVDMGGRVEASGGHVLLSAAALDRMTEGVINMDGVIEARSVSKDAEGTVILHAGSVDIGGKIDVSGHGTGVKGGVVTVKGSEITVGSTGLVDAKGDGGGGSVDIGGLTGDKGDALASIHIMLEESARILADVTGSSGSGGGVLLRADDRVDIAGSISARGGDVELVSGSDLSVTGRIDGGTGVVSVEAARDLRVDGGGIVGGVVTLAADSDGTASTSTASLAAAGTLWAKNAEIRAKNRDGSGGSVTLTGARVGLTGTTVIKASGKNGGGRIKVGGDYQGQGPTRTAQRTLVGGSVKLEAKGGLGAGGRVIVWADGDTSYHGALVATGSVGGFAEVSGKKYLDFRGKADLRGSDGGKGTLLLDPDYIFVDGTGMAAATGHTFMSNPGSTQKISVKTLVSALATANVALQAAQNIIVQTAITSTSINALTLDAKNLVLIQDSIDLGGDLIVKGNVRFGDSAAVSVTTAGSQTYNNAVELRQDTRLSSTNGNIELKGSVDSGATASRRLTVDAGTGKAILNTNIGATKTLSDLVVTGTGGIELGGVFKLAKNANLYSAVTLVADLTLDTSASNGDINFDQAIDANAAGMQGLTVKTSTGTIIFGGKIGATKSLKDLTVTAGTGSTVFGTTAAVSVTTVGDQSYNNAVELWQDITLSTTNGNIVFTGDVSGNKALSVTTTGIGKALIFKGDVGSGGGGQLISLDVAGATRFGDMVGVSVTTVGDQSYNNAVTLAQDTTLISTNGNIELKGSVDSGATASRSLTVNAAGKAILNTNIGATKTLSDLDVTGAGGIELGGVFKLAGRTNFKNAVTLVADLTLDTSAGGGAITLNQAIDAQAAGMQGLTLTAGMGAVTFAKDVGTTTSLKDLTITAGTGATVFGTTAAVSVRTAGDQTYNNAVSLAQDTTLSTTAGDIVFAGRVNDRKALKVTTAGIGKALIFKSDVGVGGGPLASLDVAGATRFGDTVGVSVTTQVNQIYDGAVTLAQDTTLASTNGNIELKGSVDSGATAARVLTVNAGTGKAILNTNIGATKTLSDLDVAGAGGIELGGVFKLVRDANFKNAITLVADLTLDTSASNGAITLNQAIDAQAAGMQGLTLTAGMGAVTFGADVGTTTSLKDLTITAGTGATVFGTTAAVSVRTAGDQTYNNAVSLAQDTTLSTTAGDIVFAGRVNGHQALKVTTAGMGKALIFKSDVGAGGGPLASLDVAGATRFGDMVGVSVTTQVNQIYDGAVTLAQDTNLASTNGNIELKGSVDSGATAARVLTVNAGTGKAILNTNIGATKTVSDLVVTGAGGIELGGVFKLAKNANFKNAITLVADLTLDTSASNGAITLNQAIDAQAAGMQGLTLTAGTGAVTFTKDVGATTSLKDLTITGGAGSTVFGTTAAVSVTTQVNQIYDGAVELAQDTTLASTNGNIELKGSVDSGATARVLTVNAGTGKAILNTNIGATKTVSDLVVTGGGGIELGGVFKLAKNANFKNAVTLVADLTLDTSASNSDITLNQAIDAQAAGMQGLTLTAGTGAVTFGGNLGATKSLKDLTVTGGTGTTVFGTTAAVSVTTSGNQIYNNAVELAQDTTLISANGNIELKGSVNSGATAARVLTVNAGTGKAILNTNIGATKTVSDLVVTGGGGIELGGVFKLAKNANFKNAITLVADLTLDTSASNGAITLNQAIDAQAVGMQGLTLTAGTGVVTFAKDVGATTSLKDLTITGGTGTTVFGTTAAVSVTTSGDQIYNNAVTLAQDTTLISTNGNIELKGHVDNGAAASRSLTVDAGTGKAILNTNIGATKTLKDLVVTGAGGIELGGVFKLAGIADLNNAVTLVADLTLDTSAGNGAITLNQAIDAQTAGMQGLTVKVGTGVVTFGADVGSMTSLKDLTITGGTGTTVFGTTAAVSVTTVGDQSYNNAVELVQDTTLISANGNIELKGSVDSGATASRSLTVDAAVGKAILNTNIGATKTVSDLVVTGGGGIELGGVFKLAGRTNFKNAVTLVADLTLDTSASNGAITLNQAIDAQAAGMQGLTLTAGTGVVTFAKDVGTTTSLKDLTITGGTGTTVFGTTAAVSVTTSGDQSYNNAVTLAQDTNLSTTIGNLLFAGKVDGNKALKVTTAMANFQLAVGSTTALSRLDVIGSTGISVDSVKTVGSQVYTGNLTLAASRILETTSVAGIIQIKGNGTFNSGGTVKTAANNAIAVEVTGNTKINDAFTIDLKGKQWKTVGFDQTGSSSNILSLGADILASGAISTKGILTLTGNTKIAATTSANSNIIFGGKISGTTAYTETLEVTSQRGRIAFNDEVGSPIPLAGLTVKTNDKSITFAKNINSKGNIIVRNDPTTNIRNVNSITFNGDVIGGGALKVNEGVTNLFSEVIVKGDLGTTTSKLASVHIEGYLVEIVNARTTSSNPATTNGQYYKSDSSKYIRVAQAGGNFELNGQSFEVDGPTLLLNNFSSKSAGNLKFGSFFRLAIDPNTGLATRPYNIEVEGNPGVSPEIVFNGEIGTANLPLGNLVVTEVNKFDLSGRTFLDGNILVVANNGLSNYVEFNGRINAANKASIPNPINPYFNPADEFAVSIVSGQSTSGVINPNAAGVININGGITAHSAQLVGGTTATGLTLQKLRVGGTRFIGTNSVILGANGQGAARYVDTLIGAANKRQYIINGCLVGTVCVPPIVIPVAPVDQGGSSNSASANSIAGINAGNALIDFSAPEFVIEQPEEDVRDENFSNNGNYELW